MLGIDAVVPELELFTQGQLKELPRSRGERRRPWAWRLTGPIVSATFSRAASSVTPSNVNAWAASPSPSWRRPRRMCSVPMNWCPSKRASSCASTSTYRARSVNRSNTRQACHRIRRSPPPGKTACGRERPSRPYPVSPNVSKVPPVWLLGLWPHEAAFTQCLKKLRGRLDLSQSRKRHSRCRRRWMLEKGLVILRAPRELRPSAPLSCVVTTQIVSRPKRFPSPEA